MQPVSATAGGGAWAKPRAPDHAHQITRTRLHAPDHAHQTTRTRSGAHVKLSQAAGLYDDTIVVMHADHGYALGEHGMWEKKSNWDMAVRVPLMIKAPGGSKSAGRVTASYTDLVDVFPTLAALAGLPVPLGVDGDDVSALFEDPATPLKTAAYHQYPACKMNRTACTWPRPQPSIVYCTSVSAVCLRALTPGATAHSRVTLSPRQESGTFDRAACWSVNSYPSGSRRIPARRTMHGTCQVPTPLLQEGKEGPHSHDSPKTTRRS